MMELPFSTDQFLEVFRSYNLAIWPAQIIAYLLGIAAIALALRHTAQAGRLIMAMLAAFWLWMGAAYHLAFFSAINPAAYVFGGLFILQGLLFLAAGLWRPNLSFRYRKDAYGLAGALLILYALAIYPALGVLFGHGYPYAPLFGVAPCPTAIFTFGLLLWTEGRVPLWLLVIPTVWALIGTTAALRLGVPEDVGLLVAAMVAVAMLAYRNRHDQMNVVLR